MDRIPSGCTGLMANNTVYLSAPGSRQYKERSGASPMLRPFGALVDGHTEAVLRMVAIPTLEFAKSVASSHHQSHTMLTER